MLIYLCYKIPVLVLFGVSYLQCVWNLLLWLSLTEMITDDISYSSFNADFNYGVGSVCVFFLAFGPKSQLFDYNTMCQ